MNIRDDEASKANVEQENEVYNILEKYRKRAED